MYSIIRVVICCILLAISIIIIKNNAIHKRILYIIFTSISVVIMVILSFLPLENLFITFNSPKEAYEYYNFNKLDIGLIVEGVDCDFIIGCKKNSYNYLIVPKTEEGWKIGTGSNTKQIVRKFCDGIIVNIFQYKNTSEYFITIFDTNGDELKIVDEYNTKFDFLSQNNEVLEKDFVTYYAHVLNFDANYSLIVNETQIVFEDDQSGDGDQSGDDQSGDGSVIEP